MGGVASRPIAARVAAAHPMGPLGLEWAEYRKATDPKKSCGTCGFFRGGVCSMFDAAVQPSMVCDQWTATPDYPRLVKAEAKAAGLAVRARDTGRVLMLQRSVADEADPARGKWEFPGGCLEDGEEPFCGAQREWEEETGVQLPAGTRAGEWRTGPYVGHVYVVPAESDVPLNVGADQRLVGNPDDPDHDDCETLAWWTPTDARSNPALRDEARRGTDWQQIDASVPDAMFKSIRTAIYPLLIRKEQPSAEAVHIDGPTWVKRKRRRTDEPDAAREVPDADELEVSVIKADRAKQLVYGIVLEPHKVDSQGDWEDHGDIEKAAHRYLGQTFRDGVTDLVNLQHRWAAPGVYPVESYVAPADFTLNGEEVRKGSWVLVVKVENPTTWQEVMDGHWGGLSVEGTGRRDYQRPSPPESASPQHR